jgi:predicted house-cleaning NTP pyrophosphatase (Maf/HAM1 superfamily)
VEFDVVVSGFPETLDKASFPTRADYVAENARQKALEVWSRLVATSVRSRF